MKMIPERPEDRNTPHHKRIVLTVPYEGEGFGNALLCTLECGHQVIAIGNVAAADGKALCIECMGVKAAAESPAAVDVGGPRVRIVQVLCPSRHCLVGCIYQSPDGLEDPTYASKLLETYRRLAVYLACGICHSRELISEDRVTGWRTLEEAEPLLRSEEIEQIRTRAAIDATRRKARNN